MFNPGASVPSKPFATSPSLLIVFANPHNQATIDQYLKIFSFHSEKFVATLPGVAVDLPSLASNGLCGCGLLTSFPVCAGGVAAAASEGVAARD